MTGSAASAPAPRSHLATVWITGSMAATVAMLVNGGIWLLGRAWGASFTVDRPNAPSNLATGDITLWTVLLNTMIMITFGALLLWAMSHLPGGIKVWLALALLTGIGSLLLPMSRSHDTLGGLLLASMHLTSLAATLLGPYRAVTALMGQRQQAPPDAQSA